MKITHIEVQNILGITAASVPLTTPITLFCGPNGHGKSSLAEAVRMALVGDIEARGVKLKKDLAALVHNGAKAGSIEVTLDSGLAAFALLPGGKTTSPEAYTPPRALAFVLEPQRFAALTDNERRSFLFDLMGLKITPAVVKERLTARGVDAEKAERVGPLLKAGFDAACTEAKRKATEAKGAWRAITGETYGGVKAEAWVAPTFGYDLLKATKVTTLTVDLQHADVALESWQQQIGKLNAVEQRRTQQQAKLPGLQEQAAKLERAQAKQTADEASLAEWDQRLQATTAEAGVGRRVGLVHDLGAALDALIDAWPVEIARVDNAAVDKALIMLSLYEREHGEIGATGSPEAQAKLPEIRKSRDLMASAAANGRRDIEAIKRGQAQIEAINTELTEAFDTTALADACKQADALKLTRADLVKQLDTIKTQKAAVAAADKKTKEAAAHHADVIAWDLIAAGLAPDGIPGDMLAEALTPFNLRLAQSAGDAEWLRVGIDADMSITGDSRPYKLLSESEKWRADAMLAEAISHAAGLKLLMLDRIDVLDLPGRTDLFAWLEILASNEEIDTALLFGTLKGLPAGLMPCVASHWLQAGQVAQFKKAA